MVVTAVPWAESMRPDVLAAFGPPRHWTMEQGRSGWRAPTDTEHWSRAAVLVEGGVPVAVASAFHPRLHPTREWAYVEVSEGRRARGHGGRALAALREALPPGAGPLRAKVRSGSAGHVFVVRHGFAPIQRTRTLRVQVQGAQPHVGALRTVALVPADRHDERVVQAWSDHYEGGHSWDPPGRRLRDLCREILTDVAGSVLVVEREREVVGIALLTTRRGRLTFTGGAVHRDDPEAVEIARALLCHSARDSAVIDVELDDWMADVGTAVGPWPTRVIDESYVVAES